MLYFYLLFGFVEVFGFMSHIKFEFGVYAFMFILKQRGVLYGAWLYVEVVFAYMVSATTLEYLLISCSRWLVCSHCSLQKCTVDMSFVYRRILENFSFYSKTNEHIRVIFFRISFRIKFPINI